MPPTIQSAPLKLLFRSTVAKDTVHGIGLSSALVGSPQLSSATATVLNAVQNCARVKPRIVPNVYRYNRLAREQAPITLQAHQQLAAVDLREFGMARSPKPRVPL
jgi:hypothetical protein